MTERETVRITYLDYGKPDGSVLSCAERICAESDGIDAAFASALLLREESQKSQWQRAEAKLEEIVSRHVGIESGDTVELLLILSLLRDEHVRGSAVFKNFAMKSIKSHYPPVRLNATGVLDRFSKHGDLEAASALDQALSDEDPTVRKNARLFRRSDPER